MLTFKRNPILWLCLLLLPCLTGCAGPSSAQGLQPLHVVASPFIATDFTAHVDVTQDGGVTDAAFAFSGSSWSATDAGATSAIYLMQFGGGKTYTVVGQVLYTGGSLTNEPATAIVVFAVTAGGIYTAQLTITRNSNSATLQSVSAEQGTSGQQHEADSRHYLAQDLIALFPCMGLLKLRRRKRQAVGENADGPRPMTQAVYEAMLAAMKLTDWERRKALRSLPPCD